MPKRPNDKVITRARNLVVQAAIEVAQAQSEGIQRDAVGVLKTCVRLYAAAKLGPGSFPEESRFT